MIAANNIYGLRVRYKENAPTLTVLQSQNKRVKIKVNNADAMDTAIRFLPTYRNTVHGAAYMALPIPFQAGDVIECEAPDFVVGIQFLFDPPNGDYVMCPVSHPEKAST